MCTRKNIESTFITKKPVEWKKGVSQVFFFFMGLLYTLFFQTHSYAYHFLGGVDYISKSFNKFYLFILILHKYKTLNMIFSKYFWRYLFP